MKTYKNMIYAVLALSMMIFLPAGQVTADIEPSSYDIFAIGIGSDLNKSDTSDFNRGWNLGVQTGKENVKTCYVRTYDINAGVKSTDTMNMEEKKSDRFFAGFNSGLDEYVNRYDNAYCGM